MISAVDIDVSGLGRLMKGLQNAMVGTGGNGDLSQIVTDETRRLALECARVPTPKQKTRLEKSIRSDIGKVFIQMPSAPFTGKQRHGNGMEWLMAGPNFLMGIPASQIITDNSVLAGGGLRQLLYRLRGKLPKDKYSEIGKHGVQKVVQPNRAMIARGAMAKLFNAIKKNVGKRDASFAETAAKLGETKISAASKKHFPTKHNITHAEGLKNGQNPSITFGSNARGVQGLTQKVNRAVKVRSVKIKARIHHILTGYVQDHLLGGQIRKHGKEHGES